MFTSLKLQLSAVSMLLLASCATSTKPTYTAYTENELKLLRTSQIDHAADGAMRGAAVGAAVGAGTAALNGGDKKAVTKGAVSGGLAGGLAGGFMGFKKGDEKGKDQIQHRRLTSSERKVLASLTKEAESKLNIAIRAINKLNSQIAAGTLSPKQVCIEAKALGEALKAGVDQIESDPLYQSKEAALLRSKASELKRINAAVNKMAHEGTQQKISS